MDNNGFKNIVNPLTPYMIADFYISDEIFDESIWKKGFDKSLIRGIDLIKTMDYDKVKDYDIIQCQIDLIGYFVFDVLPHLEGKKIILLTSQYCQPFLSNTGVTQDILNSDVIFIWASHNHIFDHRKCVDFPYGIQQDKVNFYYKFLNNNKIRKTIEIPRIKLTLHDCLPDGHVRIEYSYLGIESGERLYYYDYLKKISESKFLLSPEGEMPDCSRHYECIGLDCVPICNVDMSKMFGDNMIYSSPEEMTDFIEYGEVFTKWRRPNKNLILTEYWEQRLKDRIKKME